MSAEHIDPEVIQAGITADIRDNLVPRSPWERMQAIVRAVDEKRRELAQTDPEGQRYAYAYRVVWDAGREGIMRSEPTSLVRAEEFKRNLEGVPWVERALLGTWERV